MDGRKRATLLMTLVFLLAGGLSSIQPVAAAENRSIVVELDDLKPSAVAAHEAGLAGEPFDRAAHESLIAAQQDAFLQGLSQSGIGYQVTTTHLGLASGAAARPNRFAFLINAVGLSVAAGDIGAIRTMPGVKHVTADQPMQLHLDNSVQWVRASDGPGNKTIFSRAGAPEKRFDGTGQVVAILDTGVEHSHPTFDSRFTDADFEMRTGDARPVRTAGAPYQEGVHHPKVVYFLPLTATSNEDDVGHGTHAAADSAGLKVRGPGVDRIPGNADDQIIEGVAPGALVMNYKVCETIFTCVGGVNIITAFEDALSPTDPAGNPKPVATVINMSFGSTAGDPNSANAVASNNAALAGAVVVSSAGNSGPGENTAGSPSVARRVISVAATNDPGALANSVDVLQAEDLRYTVAGVSTGAQDDTGRPLAPEDQVIKANIMGGSVDVTFPLGQHFVYAGLADTPDQVPTEVNGRICLAARGSTADAGASGTGAFANKVAQCTAKGAVAVLIFNNVDGELEATTAGASVIPSYGLSMASGEHLMNAVGFQSAGFDRDNPATWGTISRLPLRINPQNPATFDAATTGFSSRGPADNFQFVKPDITAPGQNVYAATIAAGGVSTGGGTMSDPSRYIAVSGTSFSGPHIAGAAALMRGALLDQRGGAPIDALMLRSGDAAAIQLAQLALTPQSLVRAALTNTATNLRAADGETAVPDSDDRSFIHEIGGGLLHMIEAVDTRAVLGTNDRNGLSGPDNASDPDFLPTHSFGQRTVINTEDPAQTDTITVTLENLSGSSAAGSYSLSLADGGGLKGDVTRPIVGTNGFDLALSTGSVSLGSAVGSRVSFDVSVTVDGRTAPDGLALAGLDVTGAQATEFLWWVVATGSNGESLRMPMYYRAVSDAVVFRAAPFQNAIQDDASPDQVGGVDQDGNYELSWSFPDPPIDQACGFVVEEASTLSATFSDDAEEALVGNSNSTWEGMDYWVSTIHPDTGTQGYSPIYIDEQDTTLTLSTPVAIPAGAVAQVAFESFEDMELDFDYIFVEVAGDNGLFLQLARYTGIFSGTRVVDISGFAGQSVTVRFRLVSDQLFSAPAALGWFIDDIRIELADFQPIATTASTTLHHSVTGRTTGTYYYRIAGLHGDPCDDVGSYSNVRQIDVENDACPGDPNKTDPGICGCGVADDDTDGDGTPDCFDNCPADPDKTEPGTCGCGIADDDTDGDGTADCDDGCPADADKTAPGACGCGVADTDSDGDGTPDCFDDCPADPAKTDAGTCGCGVADTDSDADGTADCNDACPADGGKTEPGTCGCGVADTDSDGDGTADCNDNCPSDSGKTDPGVCGCGTSDADSDGDGTADCNDNCPNDAGKTNPGDCGCGVADTDSDGDGAADCIDNCPNDAGKTEPGVCGCDTADTDGDGDGTPDCNDDCPGDAGKTDAGICGCGVSDADGDGDGTADCNDDCPADPAKTAPGMCGCGTADTDSDGDGAADCNEQCPADPAKTAPGMCGCGTADTDSDGDGTADCNDDCPDDPNKTTPGQCGCGAAEGSCPTGPGNGRVKGSGYFLFLGNTDDDDSDSDNISFTIDAQYKSGGELKGKLKLKDRQAGVKIDAKTILTLGPGSGTCNGTATGPNGFEFTATGKYNGVEGATFRVCGEDLADPSNDDDDSDSDSDSDAESRYPDRLYIECLSGCSYNTASRTADDLIDGGNIRVEGPISSGGARSADTGDKSAATRATFAGPGAPRIASGGEGYLDLARGSLAIGGTHGATLPLTMTQVVELDPLLLGEAPAGTPLVLTATATAPIGVSPEGRGITLRWRAADGTRGKVTALVDALGIAVFPITVQPGNTVYHVRLGRLGSNRVVITGTGL